MGAEWKEVLSGVRTANYIHPFVKLSADDTKESIEETAAALAEAGIYSMDLEEYEASYCTAGRYQRRSAQP